MMNKKKMALLVTSLALGGCLLIGGTLAYFTDKDERQNVITLGKVEGTLTETGEDGREDGTTGKDYGNVQPGDTLEKDPTVTLADDSQDAYVRISITYDGLTEAQIEELESLLVLNEGWNKSVDGYFYYNEKLTQDHKTAVIFDEVKIPGSWGNEMAEKTFKMDVAAELIQADNFTPETTDGHISGWGTVDIKALD